MHHVAGKQGRCVAYLLIVLVAVLASSARTAGAAGCKADGLDCRSNQSCCSGTCVNGAPPGSKPFGVCCSPTTCAAQGADCGLIANGTCPQPINCGACTAPETCGGGGMPNVCGCTPTTCAAKGKNCGTISDGCGGSLDCGTCDGFDTCGGSGTANVCGCARLTCADVGTTCGTISDGCGGQLTCQTRCDRSSQCEPGESCTIDHALTPRTFVCQPQRGLDGLCRLAADCSSGCCCTPPDISENGVFRTFFFSPGACTTLGSCKTASGAIAQCPGSPCDDDEDCESVQFCSGGFCAMKRDLGTACTLSHECGGILAQTYQCCCYGDGASDGVCSTQRSCYEGGGSCECSGDEEDREFGGVCPGSPCGDDSDCATYQECVGGICYPRFVP